jgi:protein deglycase
MSSRSALIAIAQGTEEIEFSSTFDVLVRAGFKVTVASVGHRIIELSRGMRVESDNQIDHYKTSLFDVVVLPGGMPGAENLAKCPILDEILKHQIKNQKFIAAICASPAVILKSKGIITDTVKATCYPAKNFVSTMGASYVDAPVIVSGNIITASGPASAIEFGLQITEAIIGKSKADEVASQLLYQRSLIKAACA